MIAVDSNILVYAHREDMDGHRIAAARLTELASGSAAWSIPWPCAHEFLATVTRPRYFDPPSTLAQAGAALLRWLESPGLLMLHEGPAHMDLLLRVLQRARVAGPLVHDARIVAICLANGVSALWSADRDFSRFPDLKIVNPLVA